MPESLKETADGLVSKIPAPIRNTHGDIRALTDRRDTDREEKKRKERLGDSKEVRILLPVPVPDRNCIPESGG